MTEHPLDRPIWASLTTRHAHLSHGGGLARRYDPGIIPFVGIGSDDADSLNAMADVIEPGVTTYVVQASDIAMPDTLQVLMKARVVQMLAVRDIASEPQPDFERLTPADAQAMLDLATLTRPGPFTLRAGELGEFWGVKRDGRLLAMAGERFHHSDFGEVSGVATHPDAQGGGLGRRLSVWMASKVIARGETPFLHAFDTNERAIGLYESIGFRIRTKLNVTVVRRIT